MKRWLLLCLRGGTVLYTVVYTSESLLRQVKTPSLAHLMQLILAWSALVVHYVVLWYLNFVEKLSVVQRQFYEIFFKLPCQNYFGKYLWNNSKKDFIRILPHCVSLYFKLRFVPKGPNLASVIEKKEILLIRMLELFNRLNLTSLMFYYYFGWLIWFIWTD